MKCICGTSIAITEKNFALIEGEAIVVCDRCKRVYSETDFSENEIELAYWKTQFEENEESEEL